MKDVILNHIIDLVFTVISVILVPMLAKWLKSKTQNEHLKSMIEDIEVNVHTVVDYMEQTVVKGMKESKEWTSENQAIVLKEAVDRILDSILDSTKKTLEENQIDISDYITTHVESYIQSKKSDKAA